MATTINFPSQLPKNSTRYSTKKPSGVLSSKFSSGDLRQRNAYNDTRRTAQLEFLFTQEECDLFAGWWEHAIANGAARFNINLFLDAYDFQSYEVQAVKGTYSTSYQSVGYFKVKFAVLVTTTRYVNAEVVELFAYWGDTIPEMLSANEPLDELINTTLPGYFGE
jgi:hypothetical protein